jgi:hypothetical protein
MAKYNSTSRSKVKRYHELASYEKGVIHAILDAGFMANIGYVIDELPYVTPTAYWREGDQLYWHGSSASRMLRAQSAGIPVCFTVAHVDGLVLARSGLMHSINYRSAMIFGNAQLVSDEEKNARLDQFIDRLFPGRSQEVRKSTELDLKATKILTLKIEEASAKIADEDKPTEDCEEDYQHRCWAGVIPIHTVIGETLTDPRLDKNIALPEYLKAYKKGAKLDDALIKMANSVQKK